MMMSGGRRHHKSLLEQVLPKLRPFQREAFEFATQGKKYERQFSSTTEESATAAVDNNVIATTDPSLLGKGRILLADEMGLGKTVTSLAIMANYEEEWPLLILCPASLRYTWPAEIEKFFPSLSASSVYVVSGFQDIGFTKQRKNDVKVVIITYSLLQKRSAVAQILEEQNFQCIIVDESHNLKQKNSQRSQIILPTLRRSKRLLLLSGTPAMARPVELWTQLSCLAPKLFGKWTAYTQRYCNPKRKQFGAGRFVWDFSGSSHEAELHAKLKNVMVRRLKSDVLQELPPKQRSIIQVAIHRQEKQRCRQVMADLKEKRVALDELFGDEAKRADLDAKSQLMLAYQTTGIGKAQAVADYLMDWLSGSETQKILVFAHHKAVLDLIDQTLLEKRPNSHIRIDGSVPTAVRAQLVRKFQTCARVRVGLLSMTAAGVGLTLTAASSVLFAELHWTPGVLAQAEDRAHRIGQKSDSVQILYMVCKDETLSVDMALWKMLGKKIGTLGQVVDGKEDVPYIYNAQESPSEKLPGTPRASGKSVQDELSSFFAEASANEETIRKKSPVKGSIQSYFRRVESKTQKPDSSQKEAPSNKLSSLKKVAAQDIFRELDEGEGRKSTSRKEYAKAESWTCERCTFINSEGSACTMCGHVAKVKNETRSSSSTKAAFSTPGEDITWTCTTCTFVNKKDRTTSGVYYCDMCSKPCNPSSTDEADSDSDLEDFYYTPVFGRKSNKSGPANSTAAAHATGNNEEESPSHDDDQKDVRKGSLKRVTPPSDTPVSSVHWICKTCTLENTKSLSTCNYYTCDACGDAYDASIDKTANRELAKGFKSPHGGRKSDTQETSAVDVTAMPASSSGKSRVCASLASEVIVLDEVDSSVQTNKPSSTRKAPVVEIIDIDIDGDGVQKKKRANGLSDCIVIDDDDNMESKKASAGNRRSPAYLFSVSKNSGRITIHYAESGESSLVNFDVEQVVSTETADKLLDARVKRASNSSSSEPLSVVFDQTGITKIQRQLTGNESISGDDSFEEELKTFVSSYLKLRAVEKKALQESGRAFPSFDLARSVAGLISYSFSGTERYSGGAKERARENMKDGSASESDKAVIEGRACAWCGKSLAIASLKAESTYCSQECAEEGRLRRGGMFASVQIRSAVFALEGGKCTLCGIDCHALFEQVRVLPPPSRLNKLLSVNWKLPKSCKALENLLQDPKEGDFWQVDHIKPVSEGGGGCGLENLRTLCVPCHGAETDKLRARLRLQGPSNDSEDSGKRKQLDIRSAFMASGKTGTKKQKVQHC